MYLESSDRRNQGVLTPTVFHWGVSECVLPFDTSGDRRNMKVEDLDKSCSTWGPNPRKTDKAGRTRYALKRIEHLKTSDKTRVDRLESSNCSYKSGGQVRTNLLLGNRLDIDGYKDVVG